MCLTTKILHKLNSKDFSVLFDRGVAKYEELARNTVEYIKKQRKPGEKVLRGDVAEVLEAAVAIDADFEKHLDSNALSPDMWAANFSDYILERVYPQRDL